MGGGNDCTRMWIYLKKKKKRMWIYLMALTYTLKNGKLKVMCVSPPLNVLM